MYTLTNKQFASMTTYNVNNCHSLNTYLALIMSKKWEEYDGGRIVNGWSKYECGCVEEQLLTAVVINVDRVL